MTIGPLRVRLLWVLLPLALLGMVGGLFALRDVAQRIDAAERRTPNPDGGSLSTSRFSSAFSPGPRMGDLHDLLSGVEPRRADDEDDRTADDVGPRRPSPEAPEESEEPEEENTTPEPQPEAPPRTNGDEPRTPRTPRTPQSAR